MNKHNPFDWVHSEFGYLLTMVLATGAFLLKKDPAISTFFEFLVAINGLFWLQRYGKGKTDADTTQQKVLPRRAKRFVGAV